MLSLRVLSTKTATKQVPRSENFADTILYSKARESQDGELYEVRSRLPVRLPASRRHASVSEARQDGSHKTNHPSWRDCEDEMSNHLRHTQ